MSETKHTPGQWLVDYDGDSLPIILGPGVQHGFVAFLRDGDGQKGRAEANAHLIAAAPELLAACKHIWKFLDATYDVDEESGTGHKREFPYSGAGEDMELLYRVIAKAEGRNG